MKIAELPLHPPITCRPHDTLATAAQRMWNGDCGALPVVDDAGRLVGMITDRDICMATYTQGRAPGELHVANAMATDVACVHPDQPMSDAEALMLKYQVRRLPIVDHDHRPIGILSINDLVREAACPKSRLRHGADRVLHVLAEVGEHRHATSRAA